MKTNVVGGRFAFSARASRYLGAIALIGALALLPGDVRAQALDDLGSGTRVSLTTNWGDRYTGILHRTSTDSLLVQPDGWSGSIRLPVAGIEQLDRSLGKYQTTERVALHGALGALAGLAFGLAIANEQPHSGPEYRGNRVMVGGSLGALAGIVHGILTPPERWQQVSIHR